MTRLMQLTILLLSLFGCVLSSSKLASIRDKATGQLVTSSLVSWESFNPKGDVKEQFANAIAGGHHSGDTKHPVYICRTTIDTVPVTGFIIKHKNDIDACMVSQHGTVRVKPEFDILVNKYNGAKVEWKAWEKTIPFTQDFYGAVSTIGTGSRSEIYYIARHKINHTTGQSDIDHAIGWLDPKSDLGKIYAIYEAKEKSFESGEILVVIEAESYELHDIKFKTTKLQEKRNRTLLGQTILKNEGIEESDVNAVIGYEQEIVRNFGTHEGIARSVNTTVFMSKTETFDFIWGIQKSEKTMSSKTVGTRLKPGTAVNVSLYADYVTKEGPYDGQLIIHYVDGTKSKKRRVTVSSGFEASLDDKLETEYSETFWIHNDTIVPTTTKRTTTTTSTTNRSVFPTTNNNDIAITEKAKSLSSSISNGNNLVGLGDEEEEDEDESKNDINSSKALKIAHSAIILVIGSLLLTSF